MIANPYDAVLYPSYVHAQTHPSRLAVNARLFGMTPAPPDRCRVLEVGCGNGSNLVPMAYGLPDSEFVGIDLAARPVATGQAMVRDLGLRNVVLHHLDVRAVPEEWGQFDYLLAHGLYSWVPGEARDGLLRVCRERLAPQGVAFVSYNVYPGGHLSNLIREMMRFHVQGFAEPQERVHQALALMRFVADAQESRAAYHAWMRQEFEEILERAEGHLFHDELSETNHPVYFLQFVEHAGRHGLQYVAEADLFEMYDHTYTEATRATLRALGTDRLRREQYLDFLKCRRFRQTLLCRNEVTLSNEPVAAPVREFTVSSHAQPTAGTVDLRPGVSQGFRTPRQATVETDLPDGKAALWRLGALWPRCRTVEALIAEVGDELANHGIRSGGGPDRGDALAEFLLRNYTAGVVDFHWRPPPTAGAAGERPVASPVARWQAARGTFVATLRHTGLQVADEVGRELLRLLDGTRDRATLRAEMLALLKARQAIADPRADEARLEAQVTAELEKNLEKLAALGLLVA